MSHQPEASPIDDRELEASETAGYVINQKKTLAEYAELDKEDESLAKWKASLGIGAGAATGAVDGPRVSMISLSLVSESRKAGPIELDLTNPEKLKDLKKNPIVIKEGAEYAVELKFSINHDVVTGLRYIQVVRRAGINVDKLESMIGSFGPSAEPIVKRFVSEEAPSGMIARSGSYNVRSRVIDDDKTVYVDFEWGFTLKKDW
ncbi:E set domain-containing protein [Leucosporidium creatinivorum]|uniref:Rho GDP-dissociation inhibitor n=1 Tax=Leucosporidium creatinivorum TaxID=106004 RepID=A0A1Y2FJH8_9BASI|nr:E set domain-containing protein [Leucosporidium creatinivorum]